MYKVACLAVSLIGMCGSAISGEHVPARLSRPLRAVFLASYAAQVDAHLLMRRFDIEGKVIGVSQAGNAASFGYSGFYWPELMKAAEELLAEVRDALATDWEVAAVSDVPPWSAYPEDIRRAILSAVAAGRALVVRTVEPLKQDLDTFDLPPLEKSKMDLARFPFQSSDGGRIAAYSLGRGRVVEFRVRQDARFGYLLSPSAHQSDFEYSALRAAWLLLRAARPGAPAGIASLKGGAGRVAVALDPAAQGARLLMTVRRRDDYQQVITGEIAPQLRGTVDFSLPQLPGGEYLVEARLYDAGGALLDWDALFFTIVGSVSIEEFSADRKTAAVGDKVTFHAKWTGEVPGLRMRLRWQDHWDRLLLETPLMEATEEFSLRVPVGVLSVINSVELTLHSGRGPEARATTEVLVPGAVRPTDFYMLYWSTGVNACWRYRLMYDALRLKGMADAISNCSVREATARTVARAHLRTVPYATAFHGITLGDRLFNEEWLAGMERRARGAAQAHAPYGALGYTLGDENYVNAFRPAGRFCNTPVFWQMFQNHLKEVYPDLAALNAQWGTDFDNWEDIRFRHERGMLPDLDNPSAWTDYRMFVTQQFCRALQRMRRAIQEEHPGAWVGWDGAEQYSSYDGFDWWQLVAGMDITQLYHTYIISGIFSNKIFNGQAVKSFRPQARLRGAWLNNANPAAVGDVPWYLALTGWNSAWWWYATWLDPVNGALTWDLQLHPLVEKVAASVARLKSGPATLLAHAQLEIDPIAVHYSENNWHASTLESGVANHINNLGLACEFWDAQELVGRAVRADDEMKTIWGGIAPAGHYAVASKNFYMLMHDLGFQPRTMARQEIESGALISERTKVLVLPFVVSLSDAEAGHIRAFVEKGGLLIADYRCGVRDLHGRLRAEGALDDVFGILRRSGRVKRASGVVRAETARHYVSAEYQVLFREELDTDGATAMGMHEDGTPAFFLHRFGEGMAVYLNADIYCYDRLRREGRERALRELFRDLLTRYGNTRAPLIPKQAGAPLGSIEVTRWRSREGDASFIGLLPDYYVDDKRTRSADLGFRAGQHIYDVRRRVYLGPSGHTTLPLTPGRAEMLAVLPYKISTFAVTGPSQVLLGKPVTVSLTVDTDAGPAGFHAARVRVRRPDGEAPEWLRETVHLPAGRGRFTFVPALNEPPGRWTVEATESISGLAAQWEIEVTAPRADSRDVR